VLTFHYRWLTFHVFLQVAEFFYNDRILGQAGRKIGESVGSISRGPTPGSNGHPAIQLKYMYSTLLLALLFGCVVYASATMLFFDKFIGLKINMQ
jgi:hypothetical protein